MTDQTMAREYRAELKDLKRNRRKISGDSKKAQRDLDRQISKLTRDKVRGVGAAIKHTIRIDRRIAILEGRLA